MGVCSMINRTAKLYDSFYNGWFSCDYNSQLSIPYSTNEGPLEVRIQSILITAIVNELRRWL